MSEQRVTESAPVEQLRDQDSKLVDEKQQTEYEIERLEAEIKAEGNQTGSKH